MVLIIYILNVLSLIPLSKNIAIKNIILHIENYIVPNNHFLQKVL